MNPGHLYLEASTLSITPRLLAIVLMPDQTGLVILLFNWVFQFDASRHKTALERHAKLNYSVGKKSKRNRFAYVNKCRKNSLQTCSIKSILNHNFLLINNKGQWKLMFCSNHVKYFVYLDQQMVASNTVCLLMFL